MEEWVVIHKNPNRDKRRKQQRALRLASKAEFKRQTNRARKFKMTEEHLRKACLDAQAKQGNLHAFVFLPSTAQNLLLKGGPQGVPVAAEGDYEKFDAQEVLDFLDLKKDIFGDRIEG